jgi:inorganic phosphate transporter, PiT family
MSSSILGKLVSSNLPETAVVAGLTASVALLTFLTLLHIPVSLSNCTVGAFVGSALAAGSTVKLSSLLEILGSWVAIPFLGAVVAVAVYELIIKLEANGALTTIVFFNRLLLIAAVFFVSFALGANNIGLIVSFSKVQSLSTLYDAALDFAVFATSALGMVLFGKKIAQVVGDKLVGLSQIKTLAAMIAAAAITFAFTTVSIPVSLTQVIVGGMLGAGLARKPSLVNTRELGSRIWVVLCAAPFFHLIAKKLEVSKKENGRQFL